MRKKISIVIPTYNRKAKLNRLLHSILESSIGVSYEIIVVDDSDRTPIAIGPDISDLIERNSSSSTSPDLRIIRNPKRKFISTAKNVGWRSSSGEYVFFIDDDNVLPEKTADLLASKLDSDQRIGALMPVVYYEKQRDLVWVYSAPFARGRWKFDLVGRNFKEMKKPPEELLPTDALPNASMIRRDVLEQVGGFDESLPINSSCDLCQRIKRQGFAAYALTTAKIYHDVTLPGTPGYWAEHAAEDYARRYHEVRDWFDLMARIHQGERLLALKEFVRSMSFLLVVSGGILVHPSRNKQSLRLVYLSMFRGVVDGVKTAASADSASAVQRRKEDFLDFHQPEQKRGQKRISLLHRYNSSLCPFLL